MFKININLGQPKNIPPQSQTSTLETDIPTSQAELSAPQIETNSVPSFVGSEPELSASEAAIPPSQAQVPGVQELAGLHENLKFLRELATRIWRASKQLEKALKVSDEANLERFARRFEEIGETLAEHDIEIIDDTGKNYDAGLSLKVLLFEPTPGIAREKIIETIVPSLRIRGVLVPGQVVVATPIAEAVAVPVDEPEVDALEDTLVDEPEQHPAPAPQAQPTTELNEQPEAQLADESEPIAPANNDDSPAPGAGETL